MTDDQALLARIAVHRKICGGRPHVRGARIPIAVILDALTQGLTAQDILRHYPFLEIDDVRASVAYALRLAEENSGVAAVGRPYANQLFQLR